MYESRKLRLDRCCDFLMKSCQKVTHAEHEFRWGAVGRQIFIVVLFIARFYMVDSFT